MYLEHFGFRQLPFSLTPDPAFLFLSLDHQEALAHLIYGVGEAGGFVQLTGEVGTGKTTLCRCLLEKVSSEIDVALILNPKLTAVELVASICDELKIDTPPETSSLKVLIDRLNRQLLANHARGRRTVLVIDEAQNLSTDVLEQVRLLTNLETPGSKLLQILLIGQPELQKLMQRPELRQLAQRVTARYHLGPLSRADTARYIAHRLTVAGATPDLFRRGALKQVHRLSGGVPRLINVICDRSLLGGFIQGRRRIGARLVRQAEREIAGRHRVWWRRAALGAGLAVLALAAGLGGLYVWRPAGLQAPTLRPVAVEHRQAPDLAEPVSAPAPHTGARAVAEIPEPAAVEAAPAPPPPLAPAPDPEPPVGLAGFLAALPAPAAPETAFEALLGLWGLPPSGGTLLPACIRALGAGLQCLEGEGRMADLLGYNQPAVVELWDAGGRTHSAVLGSHGPGGMTLELGGERLTVTPADFERHWNGRFTLLWRAPALSAGILQEGSRGGDVAWLRHLVDRIEGAAEASPGPPEESVFDASLRRRVMRFQLSQGLAVDGVVGPKTLMRLMAAAGDTGGPQLHAQP